MKTPTTEYNYNYCDNSNDDEEVIISKNADAHADADNVVHAYAKQPSYDARFNAEEEVYAKAYAFALETAQQSPMALAE